MIIRRGLLFAWRHFSASTAHEVEGFLSSIQIEDFYKNLSWKKLVEYVFIWRDK